MTNFIINIIAKSNLAEVLAADDVALQANTGFISENSNALRANSLASGKAGKSGRSSAQSAVRNAAAMEKNTNSIKKSIMAFLGLDSAQSRVGYNFMGFSFRVHQWFVPAMALIATSILPVIAGLLAMGTAAVLAGGALVGVFALGALAQMRKQGRGGFKGYGGARRPYESSQQSGYARLSTIFEPVWKVLESPQLKSQMENATWFFQATIGAFAEGLSQMIQGIDPGMLKMLEDMFLKWLPKGMGQFAKWGSAMVKMIGSGTIKRMGDLVDWIARGLSNAAKWLNNEGGWGYVDTITSMLDDMITHLMDLGKSALPIFTAALASVYPNPLRPMLECMTDFLKTAGENKVVLETITLLLQLLTAFGAYRLVMALLVPLVGTTAGLVAILIISLVMLFKIFEKEISDLVVIITSVFMYVFDWFRLQVAKLDNLIQPGKYDDQIKELETRLNGQSFESVMNGEYAPDFIKSWNQNATANGDWKKRSDQFVNVILGISSRDGIIEDVVTNGTAERVGSNGTSSTNLRPTMRMRVGL